MSTLNKKNKQQQSKESRAKKCERIIARFNDPSKPLSTNDFKAMLFFCLLDAYTNGDQASVSNKHVTTMYFLWEILDEIEGVSP